ncbi:metal resistance protein [Aureimonas sp. SA4125]|uniref:metal-sensing transcriptional repressor n=1 Tax=Aureimonas sp. SA4125 TaxID=2826993 RepID=UPI001CC5DA12|nr:metal-sensing transcriptional repressor [Aureimonas sp. SA4125]BDA84262.1 metal resistance protein [Aureimonas sp. SA4125]
MSPDPHHSHAEIVKRLKRIEGQVRSCAAMIEAGRPCPDIAQQLSAATNALTSAKNTFIRDHIEHCLVGATEADAAGQLAELKTMTKYL